MFRAIMTKPLENALNHYLALDGNIKDKLKPLSGKCLKLEIPPMVLFFHFTDEGVQLDTQSDKDADTSLKGSLFAFLQMQLSDKSKTASFFKKGIVINGDVEFGQAIQTFFATINIDWEEHLSKITGDILAHQLTKAFNDTKNWLNDVGGSMQLNLKDYLEDEADYLVCREEVNDFFDSLDALRLRIDRLSANIDGLTK